MTAKFHIPDFNMHWELNLNLIDMIKEHPEFFRDIEIASCYGCFSPALWNGGRTMAGFTANAQIENTIEQFNSRGVPIRYTFTNPTVTEEDLKDRFCNRICKMAENGFNEIIVNVPLLEKYVRENYPKYPLISSTVKQIRDTDALIAELGKDYKLVVLDYNWNNDFEKLAKIPEELRARCEILINPYCMPNCQRRGDHYIALGECQRDACRLANHGNFNQQQALQRASEFECPCPSYNFYKVQEFSTFIKSEDVFGRYLEMGFCNFKIEGRTISLPNVLESYVYYMAKPEYRDRVRLELFTAKKREPISPPPARRFINTDGTPVPQA